MFVVQREHYGKGAKEIFLRSLFYYIKSPTSPWRIF